MKYFNKTLIAVSVALVSGQTLAAGFQLNSQSATGIGRAFAGDAVIADNASVLSRNPAAMALFDSKALSMGLTYADIDVDVKDIKLANGMGSSYGSEHDAADAKVIPNFYYIQPLSDKWAFGVAAFSNFGTGTDTSALANNMIDLPSAPGLPPKMVAPVDLLGNTEVTTINLNGSLSYRVNEYLSLGAGLDIIYGQGKLTRNGNLPLGPNGELVHTDLVNVDADGWAIGGIVGAVFELDKNNRWGVSYRISPEFDAEGDISTFSTQAGAMVEFDKITIPLPDIFQIAGFHQITEKFALHYTAQLSTWGDFDQITVKDGSIGGAVAVPDSALKHYKWDDSWLFSVGATYQVSDKWTVRAGFMHDKGVVDSLSSISIPDSDRNWYTAGASYQLSPNSAIDMGVAFVRGQDVTVLEESAVLAPLEPIGGNYITAGTRSNAVYYSVQYSYQF
ncbi:outer membrane protein transport protein [Shewanella algae]|uniref:OmpP1/FadL family transporter n=1 Tax=Shewanella TaxID=22 RepID=UPI000D121279|nr:porin [Shewanella algae]MBO2561492.1 outer membrane protein transport protein [Shewanella algae]MBO2582899.1 outer membrane protein transport protein [Shewanella algae]MBO2603957.1 outer membrane protein transport protein [Shewanella algae]MBO2616649.1 outer membrane protein transport protein [Shewanella algae]MBO2654334.1 outer membrane protein transport protein [Shewanella algae]